MNLTFLAFGDRPGEREMASMMVRSARHFMPGIRIIQATDYDTQAFPFVDGVRRYPNEIMPSFCLFTGWHMANCEYETIYADTDIIFRADIQHLFKENFDVGLCMREFSDPLFITQHFVGGIILIRQREFFNEVLREVWAMPLGEQMWYGGQLAFHKLALKYKVLELPCAIYNHSPVIAYGDSMPLPPDSKVIHYKGPIRKKWMLADVHGLMKDIPA